MRREGRDRLDIDTGDDAVGRHHDFGLGVAGKAIAPGQSIVVPRHHDRGGALGGRGGLADHRHEVARLVELGEVGETGLGSGLGIGGTGREAGAVDALDGLVGSARITGEGHGIGVVGGLEVGPGGRDLADEVGVHEERQHAVIVAVPVAFSVLGRVRDRVPGRDLVGLDQAFGLGRGAEAETDVDHVGSLRAGIALVGLDGFDFIGRAGIRVQLVDGDARILGLEAFDHGAIAAPVVRQGDGGQLAFGLGGFVERGEVGLRRDGEGRSGEGRDRNRSDERILEDHSQVSLEFWLLVLTREEPLKPRFTYFGRVTAT